MSTSPRELSVAAALSLLVTASACTPAPASSTSALLSAPEDLDHPYAVGLCIGLKSDTSCQGKTCTGTLVASNLVLTARHCIQAVSASPADYCSRTFTGQPYTPSAVAVTLNAATVEGAPWHTVSEIRTEPTSNACDDDLALLVLAQPVSASEATPVDIDLETDLTRDKPAEVAVLGRGVFAASFNPDAGYSLGGIDEGGLKRRVLQHVPIVCASDAAAGCKIDDYTTPPDNVFVLSPGLFLIGPGSGPGDSGGPVIEQQSFAAGHPRLLGVSSLVTTGKDGQVSGATPVRLDRHRDFLIAGAMAAASAAGTALPAWAAPSSATDDATGCALPGRSARTGATAALLLAIAALARRAFSSGRIRA